MPTPDWLEQLQAEYARHVPERLRALSQLADSLPGSREVLIRELHKLAGSAGSYGFGALGDAARAWELALRAGADTHGMMPALTRAANRGMGGSTSESFTHDE